ncbi:hypothetical protein NL676_004978 [Syzygium grande]|nr:hypothetical protein NL676_004978 [Syzygium grande]
MRNRDRRRSTSVDQNGFIQLKGWISVYCRRFVKAEAWTGWRWNARLRGSIDLLLLGHEITHHFGHGGCNLLIDCIHVFFQLFVNYGCNLGLIGHPSFSHRSSIMRMRGIRGKLPAKRIRIADRRYVGSVGAASGAAATHGVGYLTVDHKQFVSVAAKDVPGALLQDFFTTSLTDHTIGIVPEIDSVKLSLATGSGEEEAVSDLCQGRPRGIEALDGSNSSSMGKLIGKLRRGLKGPAKTERQCGASARLVIGWCLLVQISNVVVGVAGVTGVRCVVTRQLRCRQRGAVTVKVMIVR